jgi:hypothetical protein
MNLFICLLFSFSFLNQTIQADGCSKHLIPLNKNDAYFCRLIYPITRAILKDMSLDLMVTQLESCVRVATPNPRAMAAISKSLQLLYDPIAKFSVG